MFSPPFNHNTHTPAMSFGNRHVRPAFGNFKLPLSPVFVGICVTSVLDPSTPHSRLGGLFAS